MSVTKFRIIWRFIISISRCKPINRVGITRSIWDVSRSQCCDRISRKSQLRLNKVKFCARAKFERGTHETTNTRKSDADNDLKVRFKNVQTVADRREHKEQKKFLSTRNKPRCPTPTPKFSFPGYTYTYTVPKRCLYTDVDSSRTFFTPFISRFVDLGLYYTDP